MISICYLFIVLKLFDLYSLIRHWYSHKAYERARSEAAEAISLIAEVSSPGSTSHSYDILTPSSSIYSPQRISSTHWLTEKPSMVMVAHFYGESSVVAQSPALNVQAASSSSWAAVTATNAKRVVNFMFFI